MSETEQQLNTAAGVNVKSAPPSIRSEAFNCPHCGAYTHQYWHSLYAVKYTKGTTPLIPTRDALNDLMNDRGIPKEQRKRFIRLLERLMHGQLFFETGDTCFSTAIVQNLNLSQCFTCDELAVWIHDRLVHPAQRTGPEPNQDLPADIRADYEEARTILDYSPRGSAALLRLCVEKLCIHLNAEGSTLGAKIGDLVRKGLDPRVQKALDAVRVIGNEAVHPGQMDLKDDRDTAEALFRLINVIAEKTISEPKHVEAAYASLPESKRHAIALRDKSNSPS